MSEANKDLETLSDLHVAAALGNPRTVETFLKSGVDVNSRNRNYATPLIVAARAARVIVCEKLLKANCDVDAQDKDGRAALHEAARNGNVPICKMLLENQATVDIRTDSSNTPLHEAAGSGSLEVVKVLLAKQADPQAVNNQGRTPTSMANLKDHDQVVDYIINHLEKVQRSETDRRIEENCDSPTYHSAPKSYKSRYVQEFDHKSLMGEGSFAVVMRALFKLANSEYAVKRIVLPEGSPQLKNIILREIHALAKLQHENIVKYHYAWVENPPCWVQKEWDASVLTYDRSTPEGEEASQRASARFSSSVNVSGPTTHLLYIQLELCKDETLGHQLDRGMARSKKAKLTVCQQLASGVHYLHEQQFIHRDLKPYNVLFSLDGSTVKIGDFGLSTAIVSKGQGKQGESSTVDGDGGDKGLTTNVGTPLYMGPEQLSGADYNKKADIFAMGLITYEVMSPFGARKDERAKVFKSLRNQEEFPKEFLELYPNESKLIKTMLNLEPTSRPGAYFVEKRCSQFKDNMRKVIVEDLLAACVDGKLDEVKEWVLRKGGDIEAEAPDGATATHVAVYEGHMEIVRFLMDHGAPLDKLSHKFCESPLHKAAGQGRGSIARLLLEKGANPLKVNCDGETPRQLAFENGHYSLAKVLQAHENEIQHNSTIVATSNENTESIENDNFLDACDEGNVDLVKDIISTRGVSALMEVRDALGNTGLHKAAKAGQEAMVSYLLAHGWSLNQEGHQGGTPLHIAVAADQVSTCTLLIREGAVLEARDHDGDQPIHWAVLHGSISAADLLLKEGAHVEDTGRENWTCLHWAVFSRRSKDKNEVRTEMIQYLLDKGANVKAVDAKGRSVLKAAEESHQTDILKLFEMAPSKKDLLQLQLMNLRLLLEFKVEADQRDTELEETSSRLIQ